MRARTPADGHAPRAACARHFESSRRRLRMPPSSVKSDFQNLVRLRVKTLPTEQAKQMPAKPSGCVDLALAAISCWGKSRDFAANLRFPRTQAKVPSGRRLGLKIRLKFVLSVSIICSETHTFKFPLKMSEQQWLFLRRVEPGPADAAAPPAPSPTPTLVLFHPAFCSKRVRVGGFR